MKELEEIITLNGKLYYDADMVRRLTIHAKEEGHKEGYEKGKSEGYKAAQVEGVAIGYTDADIARTQKQWYNLGYEAGKKDGYSETKNEGSDPLDNTDAFSTIDYQQGYNIGKAEGSDIDYTIGYETAIKTKLDCKNDECIGVKESEYDKGWDEGYKSGYEKAYEYVTKTMHQTMKTILFIHGYDNGKKDGYYEKP